MKEINESQIKTMNMVIPERWILICLNIRRKSKKLHSGRQ